MHQKGKTVFYKRKVTWTGPDLNDGHRMSDLGRDHAESFDSICGGFIAVDHAVHRRRIHDRVFTVVAVDGVIVGAVSSSNSCCCALACAWPVQASLIAFSSAT